MIKFLIYLFLFYVVFRFVFNLLFGAFLKTKIYKFETHHHYNKTNEPDVKVYPKDERKPKQQGNIGEYVDYEEIKE